MWTHEVSIETTATPEQIWRLFSDVPGWKKWNAGIVNIEIHGPFANGTTFTMQVPGGDTFVSTLIEVKENESFTDETLIDETRVVVHHTIVPMSPGHSRILYSVVITGPDAAEIGPIVTEDFPAVLLTLKSLAENVAASL